MKGSTQPAEVYKFGAPRTDLTVMRRKVRVAPTLGLGSWLGTYSAAQSAGNASGQLLGGALLSVGRFAYPFLAGGECGVAALILLPRVESSPAGDAGAPARTVSRGGATTPSSSWGRI